MSLYQPIAPQSNTIRFGRARFQLLGTRLLRLEWAGDEAFEDRPTLTVTDRQAPPVPHRLEENGDRLRLETEALTLQYRETGKGFNASNLSIAFSHGNQRRRWRPGQKDDGNLGGSCRTLDGARGRRLGHGEKIGPGLLSRSGWTLIDDSDAIPLETDTRGRSALHPRTDGPRQDWYFLAAGLDYREALAQATRAFGVQPLPPRFALGYWYSRYWAYTDRELEQLVRQFDAQSIPLDVLVIDMDWHREGWTGYSWDPHYFPDHRETLDWFKKRDLKVTLNLHPADGVGNHEDAFPTMCRELGLDPDSTDRIPFDATDPEFIDAYFRHLHHDQEEWGVDFWWMDWQQGRKTAMPGLDPLPWLNHLHWEDQRLRRPDRRPLIFSRFGGIGAGRNPVGFSGDTISVWKSLEYQPEFTARAANVLYGYWSHDIGGHMPGTIDGELYTRWVQFGLYSPILRTHTCRTPEAERRFWRYPEPYSHVMADTVRRRYELVPYIYSELARGRQNGISLVHPLYYDHPRDEAAYQVLDQYAFGEQMLVAPVLTPLRQSTETAGRRFWLPPGEWFDTAQGRPLPGGSHYSRNYRIEEIPVFVRPGAILPGQQPAKRLRPGSYADLLLSIWPGANEGQYLLYEDDGISQGYLRGESAEIPLRYETRAGKLRVMIGPARGRFPGFLKQRSLEVRLPVSAPPRAVRLASKALPWSHRLENQQQGWRYDAEIAGTLIRIDRIDITRQTTIEIDTAPPAEQQLAHGLPGLLRRLERLRQLAAQTNLAWHKPNDPARAIAALAQTGNRIERQPQNFANEAQALHNAGPELLRCWNRISRRNLNEPPNRPQILKKARAIARETVHDFLE